MNKQEISTFIHYNFWANGRILSTCENLTANQFIQAVTPDPGWGSLRGILVHTLDTEYGWRTVLQDLEDTIINETDFADVATLKARWEIEKSAWFEYETVLTDEMLIQGYGDDPKSGPKAWQTIMHVMMHSMQHRAEVATFLTGLGYSPGELDFAVFMKENSIP
ncbi:MAG: DinB family protein [Chloroflexota bacterium]